MTRALQHLCLTENSLAYARLRDQILDGAATFDGMDEPEPDSPPNLQTRTRDELQAAVATALAKADELFGERLGMLLVLMPESDKINAQIEAYIDKHQTTQPVVEGMKAMKKELTDKQNKQIQEATSNAKPVAGGGLSDEASGSPDARHRSSHHNHLRKKTGVDLNPRIFPLVEKLP